MSGCVADSDLHRFHAGEMSEAEEASVRNHLDQCSDCRMRDDALMAEHAGMVRRLKQLDDVDVEASRPAETDLSPIAGEQIGPYKLLEKLGEGGFGVVYLAEQQEPVLRRVALKIIKIGMDTRRVIARFEAERQALAMMDHPNVARVLDAGATDRGRPYFVMEHVAGIPITDHCDRHRLNIDERLELFIQACEAVQHAHQKGIIHRDLKPGNILVTVKDDKPTVKVIDFGVAKALSQHLTEETVFTEQGQLIGTPEYMSPEQAEMTAQDIDTRSDIYALGVLLYELVTGLLPFDREALRSAGPLGIQRMIREQDPLKPSSKLSVVSEARSPTLDTRAHHRRIEPRALGKALKGDLDWIVMKALEKDRTRRYASASNLANDIQRHLHNEPVWAGPPSTTYRVAKFVRRNRPAVLAALLVFAVLVGGVAVTSIALHRAVVARRAETQQREEAQHQAAIAQAINDFLNNDLLAAADPNYTADRAITVREVLDTASERIEGRFADEPLVEAAIRSTLGTAYYRLGEEILAHQHIKRAGELYTRSLGEEDPLALDSGIGLVSLLSYQGLHDEAERLCHKVLETSTTVLGERHPITLDAMHMKAWLLFTQGRFAEAEPIFRRTFNAKKETLGPEHEDTLTTMCAYGLCLHEMGRLQQAEPLLRGAYDIRRRLLGDDHPSTLTAMDNLGAVLKDSGRIDDSLALFKRCLDHRRRVLGEEHRLTLGTMSNVADVLGEMGRLDEAVDLHRELLAIRRRVLGDAHQGTVVSLNNLAMVLMKRGEFQEACALFEEALRTSRELFKEGHWYLSIFQVHYGECLAQLGEYAAAETQLLVGYEGLRVALGETHEQTQAAALSIADLYEAWSKPEAASRWRMRLPMRETGATDNHSSTKVAP